MKPAFNRIEPDLPYSDQVKSPPPVGRKRAFSFEIRRAPQQISMPTETASNPETQNQELNPDRSADSPQSHYQGDSGYQTTNPVVGMNQTPEPLDIATCEAQLQRIVGQIEQLYFEGPIVGGWLESFTATSDVMPQDAVEELPNSQIDVSNLHSEPQVTRTHTNYHLCGLDVAGQKWCYPCPIDQLPSVSIAIARYQKLKQLLTRKQYLENCLRALTNVAD